MDEAEDFLFPPGILADPARATLHSFLSPFNVRVDEFNRLMMSRISGAEGTCSAPMHLRLIFSTNCFLLATYLSYIHIKEAKDPTNQLPSAVESDYLTMLNEPGVPPHKLQLNVGTICSVMRNLSIEKGLVKNARVRILELHRHVVRWNFYI